MSSIDFYSKLILILLLISISAKIHCKSVTDWYSDRHKITNDKKVLTVAKGSGKGFPITVTNCGITAINRRIVGGVAAKLGQFPWATLIFIGDNPFCGGSILNERWILTAAHCFKERKNVKKLSIKVGMVESKEGTSYQLSKIIIHEKYNSDNMEVSDLALLKTAQPIKMERSDGKDTINGICLPGKFEEPKANKVTVTGWGRLAENEEWARGLQLVNLNLINLNDCQKKLGVPMVGYPNGYKVYKTQLCTHTKDKDACQGDSGGPAIEIVNGKAYLVGVISYGVGCVTEFPGVYTKVSHYLDWIAQNVD